MHGYDIVDHGAINPELGGLAGFNRFSDAVKAAGLGLVVDIVPNHAGIGGSHNPYWLSVLEWGSLSPVAHMFDIDWNRPEARGKLVAPFLATRYGIALAAGNIRLAFDKMTGGFNLWHHEHQFPICPLHYPDVFACMLARLDAPEGSHAGALRNISETLRAMSNVTDARLRTAFSEEADGLKLRIKGLVNEEPAIGAAVDQVVSIFNGVADDADAFGMLHRLIERQPYRLSHWRVAESDLNYRRFFDINTLAGLRAEDPDVFERTHREIFRLIREKRIGGLRIDHVDGLADPEGYLARLRTEVGPELYIVVEKILGPGEALRAWPVAGTTGYEALNLVDGLFVDARSADRFTHYHRHYVGTSSNFSRGLRGIKAEMMSRSFGSEFETLVGKLKGIADGSPDTRDFTRASLARIVSGMISQLPVYRSYLADRDASVEDLRLIEETASGLKGAIAPSDGPALDFFVSILLGLECDNPDFERAREIRRLFQQLSGPVMAKSLEDTLFYRDTRLVALNEVGGDPTRFGVSLTEFHAANMARARFWPHSMIATQTHDSKRGEDFRARLVALSEAPTEWEELVKLWREATAGDAGPDDNDRYFILQTIIGAWPVEMLEAPDAHAVAAFVERLNAYFVKSFREAKRHSSWLDPNSVYEDSVGPFVRAALAADGRFLHEAQPFVRKLAYAGMLNSLSRLVIKCTIPGTPDTYQGTEFWDLSLVDPDNRRPVDFHARSRNLASEDSLVDLLENWRDGRIKQAVLARLLADRAGAPELYAFGDYRPLSAAGAARNRVIAFGRNSQKDSRVVLAGRLLGSLAPGDEHSRRQWSETFVPIQSGRWREVLTGKEWRFNAGKIDVGALFSPLHVAVLQPIAGTGA